ncbi:MAG: hypothetical protein COA96_14260 [SAR86 cluster bacterium]|uniref:Uncharacterized protein n=1 Tax=SAR86 cluster bacterium TaxID=2030880 RepID=A0A2A5ATC0_9GAMM|nr:MAG: hypothetical protein COA96_14260 [SAR86 cluster bacterium]
MTKDLLWKRITLETIAIVGAILLAFAVDAWWENRQVQAAEHQFLQALVLDLQETKRRMIDFGLRLRDRQGAIGNALVIFGSSNQGSVIELQNLLWPIGITSTFETNGATLERMIETEEFRSLESPTVQRKLMSVITRIGYFQQSDLRRADFWHNTVASYAIKYAAIYKFVVRQDSNELGYGLPTEATEIDIQPELNAFYSNREFANILFLMLPLNADAGFQLDRVETEIEELLAIIESEYEITI